MKTILTETAPLDAGGVDALSEKIGRTLSAYPHLTRRDILRLQLSAEELLLLHWMDAVRDARVQLNIQQKGRWLNIQLLLEGPGCRCDPLNQDSALGGGLADSLLATLGIGWIYQFDRGENSVYISVEAEKSHQVRHAFLAMALGLAVGLALRLIGPQAAEAALRYVVDPLFNIGSHFLTAIVSPMMLLAVVDGILSSGSPRSLDRVGRYACTRFLISTFLIILCAGLVCALCFPFRWGFGSGSEAGSLLDFITDIVPDNIITPFVQCNMLQIIFLGVVLGIAMLFLQRQVQTVGRLVEEGNALICRILVGFEKALPLFVGLSMASTALTTDLTGLLHYAKAAVLLALFLAAVTAVQFWLTARRLRLPGRKLWAILKPSFMVQLASASSSAAFTESYEACERGFGIDRKLVRFALPIGTVMHKPLIAAEFIFLIAAAQGASGGSLNTGSMLMLMLLAFLLSVAYPPVSGGEITCYTMLLLQMGMDPGLLAVACTLSSLFDTLEAPGNTLCTELQLAMAAQRHGMIREKQGKTAK